MVPLARSTRCRRCSTRSRAGFRSSSTAESGAAPTRSRPSPWARAVLIGRPYAYALGIGGSGALTDFLRGLLAEMEITIGLCGLRRPSEATPELLTAWPADRYLFTRRIYSLPR